MANGNDTGEHRGIGYRNWLALLVLGFSIVAVTVLAITVIKVNSGEAIHVMSAVLPLLGSWVGTILAYYFSKENFEAATKSVTALAAQVSPQEKLRSTPVKDKMIKRGGMHIQPITTTETDEQLILADILNRLVEAKKGQRIPFLNERDNPLYVIHRSTIDRFLTDKFASSSPPADIKTLTLRELLDALGIKDRGDKTFAVVKEDATLADAKAAMEAIPGCQDVFITKSGTMNEPVVGWITNVMIESESKV
jgi:hypothetical protein